LHRRDVPIDQVVLREIELRGVVSDWAGRSPMCTDAVHITLTSDMR
jgi:hypothetical protein